MKRLERILQLLALAGMLSGALAGMPGSDFLIAISLSALSFIYFYLGVALFNDLAIKELMKADTYRRLSQSRILFAILSGAALSICSMAILFQLLHFPGATVMTAVALTSLGAVSMPMVFRLRSLDRSFYQQILLRTLGFGLINLSLVLSQAA